VRATGGSVEKTSNKAGKRRRAPHGGNGGANVGDRKNGKGPTRETLVEQCRQLEQRAEAAEARRADLLSIASHDLRNPLGVILVTTSMLARETTSPSQARQVAAVRRAAIEMNQIIEDFVDAAAIDGRTLLLGQDVHDGAEIAKEAIAAATTALSERSITVETNIEQHLPLLYVDKVRLLQVFSRVVANASRFMPKNGTITIGAEKVGHAVKFFVADSGPGIPDSQRPFVFSRRPPPERRAVWGAGLGMFVAKGIVEAHGGHVEVASEAGRGSTVSFTLPAVGSKGSAMV
jgi:signal transduction histidine kinase